MFGGDPITVEWEGAEVTITPYKEWRASTNRAMREGDFQRWAEGALEEESLDHWDDVDPKLEQVDALFQAWVEAAGINPGEASTSTSSRTSSRRPSRK
jgi:hypothetical protein